MEGGGDDLLEFLNLLFTVLLVQTLLWAPANQAKNIGHTIDLKLDMHVFT